MVRVVGGLAVIVLVVGCQQDEGIVTAPRLKTVKSRKKIVSADIATSSLVPFIFIFFSVVPLLLYAKKKQETYINLYVNSTWLIWHMASARYLLHESPRVSLF